MEIYEFPISNKKAADEIGIGRNKNVQTQEKRQQNLSAWID